MSDYFLEKLRQFKDIIDELESYFASRKPYMAAMISTDQAVNFDFDDDGNYILKDGEDPDEAINNIIATKIINEDTRVKSAALGEEGDETPMPKLKEGSITKRKDGRWMGRYYIDGIIQAPLYARSEREIVTKLNQAIIERDARRGEIQRMQTRKASLAEAIKLWFDEWKLAKSKDRPLSSKTIQNVEYSLIRYVVGHKLSKKELGKITFADIDMILDSIPTKSMQARTFSYLKLVYKKLQIRGMIKQNPLEQVEPRTRPKAKTRFIPDTTTWYSFLEWLKVNNQGIYFFVKFIANTGLRKGEALALTFSDVSLETMRIRINKSYSDLEKRVIDHPKTDAGFREVPIFEDALEVLESIPKEKRSNEIFWMVSKTNVTHTFPKLAKRYGLPHLTLHGLRHLFASECRRRGVDKKTYSLWMGHADTEITDDYTHVTSEFEEQEIKKMAISSHRKKKV